MQPALKVVLSALLSVSLSTTLAQQISADRGIGLNEGYRTAQAPPPLQAGEELLMAELPVTTLPPTVYFNHGTAGHYGPYPFITNTRIGSEKTPYLLQVQPDTSYFSLVDQQGDNTRFGPFPGTNGVVVRLPTEVLVLLRPAARLKVSINHPDRINQLPLIGLAPQTPALLRELYALRAKYIALANRVDLDTADVVLEGVPRIHHRATGSTFSPVIATSQRDKENTLRGAEQTAVRYLETLFQNHFRIRSQVADGPQNYLFGMPKGEYIFCAMQKFRTPQTRGTALTQTAIWWTTLTFDGAHQLELHLTEQNAIHWRTIFTLASR